MVLAHLVGRFFVATLVLAILALITLLTIVCTTVAATPTRLDIGVRDCFAALVA